MTATLQMNPHTLWAMRKQEQQHRQASACAAAYTDVQATTHIGFGDVTLIEYATITDVGVLRLEPNRMIFAGKKTTREIPFGSIVLLGTQPILGQPGANECSVNSTEYQASLIFRCDYPLEFHIGTWYSRWLEQGFTSIDPPATVPATTRPR